MSGKIVRRRSWKRKQSVFDAGRATGARRVSPAMGGPLTVLFGLAAVVWVGSHLDTETAVREMMGPITHHGAVSAKIVWSGKFTRQAIQFAEGKPIELVSGEALWLMVEAARRLND